MISHSSQPLGFGSLLTRIFSKYRKLFIPLLQISLLLYGPYFVLQALLAPRQATLPLRELLNGSVSRSVSEPAVQTDHLSVLIYLGISLLFALILLPVSTAAVLRLIETHARGERINIGSLIRQAFGRAGQFAGSTILYGLIILGIILASTIALSLVLLIPTLILGVGAGVLGLWSNMFQHFGVIAILAVLLYICFIAGFSMFISFFMIRWGYYVAIIDTYAEGLGFDRSWQLTKGSYWRLFGVYLVLYVIMAIVWVIPFLIPWNTVQVIVMALINVVFNPLFLVAYAVTYNDLQHRNSIRLNQRLTTVEPVDAAD